MVSLWNARSYLKELKTNLKSSQSAPVFLLPRLTSLHYKFFAQSPPPAQASAPPPMPPTPPGGSKGWHHSCHRPDSPAQRLDGATMLKWRLTTNTGWRHLLIVDSRSKQTKKIPLSPNLWRILFIPNAHSENMQEYVHLRQICVVLRQKPIQPCKAIT